MKPALRSSPIAPKSRWRRLVKPVVPPHVFDFWAARVNRLWTWERPLARLVARRAESSDATTLVLRANRHWRGMAPGQHLNVSVEIDGARVTRSYSPTAVSGRRIELTIRALEGGKLSGHLCREARIGEVLDLGPAFGEMTLRAAPAAAPMLLLAAGSGITPLMALTRELASRGMPSPLTLVYWSRTHAELCFVDELRALAATHSNFRVRFVLTREPALAADEDSGRLDRARLDACVDDLSERHVHACGPGGFVETARALVSDHARSFRAEAFSPPPPAHDETGTVSVTLARSNRTLTMARGESILSALEAAGVRPDSGCRMGICNTCACGKRAGTTRHLHTAVLDPEPASALRICVSTAASDLVLEL